jgi:hypothetical protein
LGVWGSSKIFNAKDDTRLNISTPLQKHQSKALNDQKTIYAKRNIRQVDPNENKNETIRLLLL